MWRFNNRNSCAQPEPQQEPSLAVDGERCDHKDCKMSSQYIMLCRICKRKFHPKCAGLPDGDFKTFQCLDCFFTPS